MYKSSWSKKLPFMLILCILSLSVGITTQAQAAKVTLTYLVSQGWIKDSEKALAQKFEAETGIAIDFQEVPAANYDTLVKTKLDAGDCCDLFGGNAGQSNLKLLYDVQKNAVDLSGEGWIKNEDPLTTATTTLDGKDYGLTIWDYVSNSWVITYNKAIFAKLGLTPPKTYADFKAICQKILAAGITPIYEPISDGWHHVLWFPEMGPQYENLQPGLYDKLNANKEKLADDKDMLLDLQQLQEMYTSGWFGANALSDALADAPKNMASGKFAMAVHTLGLPALIEAADPTVKADGFGFFVMPLVDNQILNTKPGSPSKFISVASTHIAEAKQYLEFLTKPENLQYFVDNTPEWSTLNFTSVKSKFTKAQQDFFATYKKSGVVLQGAVNYIDPQWESIGKDFVAMFTGSLKPADVLAQMDQRRADLAKLAKDPGWK